MFKQKKLDIFLISVMALYSLILGLGSLRLFYSQNISPFSGPRKFYYAGLIGLAVLAILIKKRGWLENRFNVYKNIRTRRLNIFLITLTLLGPLLFSLGLYMVLCAAFGGPEHHLLIFFCLVCAGPLGAISALTFLIVNIKAFKKSFRWLGLPPLVGLLIVNLYCFYPVYRYVEIFYNFNLYKLWIMITGG